MPERGKYRLDTSVRQNESPSAGFRSGHLKITGDIVSPDPELWDCELGIAFRDENGIAFDYNGDEVDMVEAVKHAR